MSDHHSGAADIKPTDLRGILKYVPQFRDHVFVIAFDGSVVDDDNFGNLLLDIAVLKSLNIRPVLVHGIGRQIKQLSEKENIAITDAYGSGPTDQATLDLAIKASGLVSARIMQGLTRSGLKYCFCNAIRATETGILKGQDQKFTGKVEKIDTPLLKSMMQMDIVPVFSPIAYNRDGKPLRINSDLLASEIAMEMKASKLIYLTPTPGLTVDGVFQMNVHVEEVRAILGSNAERIDERVRSKAKFAVKTIEGGTPRVHIIDGRVYDGLLTEIFSKVGIGTMIHGNKYQQIRKARKEDAQVIFNITQNAVKDEVLRYRSRDTIEEMIDSFYIYEIDDSVIACACLIDYPGDNCMELASVYVQPFYQGKGTGRMLTEYALLEATRAGRAYVFALTTQSYPFFRNLGGFEDATLDDLPASRVEQLKKSGRNSKILIHRVGAGE